MTLYVIDVSSIRCIRLQEQYRNVGEEVKKSNLEAMQEQMALFKTKLEEFALKARRAQPLP